MSPTINITSSLKITGLIILILFIGLLSGILPAFISPNNNRISGNPKAFDPVSEYENIKRFAGDENLKLISINIEFVKRDGTIDLKARYKPTANYTFIRKINDNADLPVGAASVYHKLVNVKISRPCHYETWQNEPGVVKMRFHLGMFKTTAKFNSSFNYEPAEKPACSLKKLWDNLADKNIPENAVAVIWYSNSGFDFSIKNTEHNYHFDRYGNLK